MEFAPLFPLVYRILQPIFPHCLWGGNLNSKTDIRMIMRIKYAWFETIVETFHGTSLHYFSLLCLIIKLHQTPIADIHHCHQQ